MIKQNESKNLKGLFVNFLEIRNGLSDEEKAELDKRARDYDEKEKQNLIVSRFSKCGLGTEYLECNFENYNAATDEQRDMKNTAISFCDKVITGKRSNLILIGSPGTGKTHILAAILRTFAGYAKKYIDELPVYASIKYMTVSDISDKFFDARKLKSAMYAENIIKQLGDYDVLAIDEIGRLKKPFVNEQDLLFKIIDKRYQNGKSTVFATNLSINELTDFFDNAMWSRLNNQDNLKIFSTDGIPDFRKMKTEKSSQKMQKQIA